MLTLGADPDTHRPAIAIVDGNSLRWHWQGNVSKKITGDDAVVEVARCLKDLQAPNFPVEIVAVEQMQVYPGQGAQGADTLGKHGLDGLIRVASVGGLLLSWALGNWPGARAAMPTAQDWKGQQTKTANHRQTIARLFDNDEMRTLMALPASRRSHVLDAVGIALWAQSGFQKRESRKDLMARARKAARKARG